jgi:hypothetical protein
MRFPFVALALLTMLPLEAQGPVVPVANPDGSARPSG